MQPQSHAYFDYPRLNGWFKPAYESLIAAANRKSGWRAFDEDEATNELASKEYAKDYCAVAALIRVCATWNSTRDQIAGHLRRPFSMTVIETSDNAWVEAVENALTDGLNAAIRSANPDGLRPNVVCFKSAWRKRTPTKTASDFNEALALAAREAAPIVAVVPSVDVLPGALCLKSTKTISLAPLSRRMVLMLFAMMHGRQKQVLMTKALAEMPSGDALARVTFGEMMLALRTPQLVAFVRQLNTLAGRSKANPKALGDVKGLGSAQGQMMRLVNDIQAYSDGRLSWTEIPNNLLLNGPPGVGKTYTALKLAEATGAHFVSASYAKWQAEGHLGDFLAAMREDFEEAKRNAPSVLLIDELDSFADRATNKSENENYNRAALNGLLEQLAGAEKVDGVLVVGTTNYSDKLDAALMRSGRFDQKIHLPLPDQNALAEILSKHAGNIFTKNELHEVAIELLGQSGADAAGLVRQARSIARHDGASLSVEHLKSALKQFAKPVHTQQLHRMAIHESGHIVAAQVICSALPSLVHISSKGGKLDLEFGQLESLENRLAVLMAGRAAEIASLGSASSGAGAGEHSDLAQATLLAVQAETQFDLNDADLIWRPVGFENMHELLQDEDLAGRVRTRLRHAAQTARKVVENSVHLTEVLAGALVERRQLNRNQIRQVMCESKHSKGQRQKVSLELASPPSRCLH